MNPFFFGESTRPLFGVYTRGRGRDAGTRAVLLCYPVLVEYMRAHRVFRQFTNLLNRAGFDVLRFDYSSTGDSGGVGTDASVAAWLEDVDWAIHELMDNAGVEEVSMVGLRFGAALAALVSAERPEIRQLVLWDPIVSGRDYFDSVLGIDRPTEVVSSDGYPVTPGLQKEVDAVDLLRIESTHAAQINILTADNRPEYRSLLLHAQSICERADLEVVPSSGDWGEADPFGAALIPDRIIQAAVSRLQASEMVA